MKDEKKSVDPVLTRAADAGVDELVFGDDKARHECEYGVKCNAARAWPDHEHPAEARQHRQRIERVPDALPSSEAPSTMKVKLVEPHRDRLRAQRREDDGREVHLFTITAPDTVRPGPKARLATGVSTGTLASSRMDVQMCGNVADDMLP